MSVRALIFTSRSEFTDGRIESVFMRVADWVVRVVVVVAIVVAEVVIRIVLPSAAVVVGRIALTASIAIVEVRIPLPVTAAIVAILLVARGWLRLIAMTRFRESGRSGHH